ncbi:OmpW family outer membrane protein [Limnohabitans sp.]|uniref:OmpW/AlkL family protein n=1 Tax=Limnohabitans sp. TaxID=1907725 RepID=UPI00286F99B1|nr:OmpW family outer membrane protein [Limnohabitans sp.]
MKKIIIAAAVGMLVAGQVAAQESPWLVRVRAVELNMANKDSTGLGLTVNDKTIGEVDVSYFFNKNVAAELILTLPQSQAVYSNAAAIGSFKHLPPTLTAQYHFTDFQGFKPYVGAGVNYTKITGTDFSALAGTALAPVTLDSHSWGAALQVGVDVPVTKQVSVNLDVKKVYIQTDVYANGAKAGTLKLDPLLVAVGVGYRF